MAQLTATRPPVPWAAPTATTPVAATVRLPSAKSMTARAPVLSAISTGPSTLFAPLRTRDTELMAAGLRAMGKHVSTVEVKPRPLHGGVFETYDDHRMAHATAVVGLAVCGIELTDVACTAKTLPEFPALWDSMVRQQH